MLSNAAQQVPLTCEKAKSFALGVFFTDRQDKPLDLTGCAVSFVMRNTKRNGGNTLVSESFGIVSAEDGYARLDLQAANLDRVARAYEYVVTLKTAENYTVATFKGSLTVVDNAETAWVATEYGGLVPHESLTIKLGRLNRVTVKVGLPYDPKLEIGTVTTLATGQPATASISGHWPTLLINLGLPKGNTGEKGDPGAPGQDGVDGVDGQDGVDGNDGTNGTNGRDVEMRMRPDEQTIQYRRVGDPGWTDIVPLNLLKGDDGADGADGAQGIPGEQGPPGEQGAPGDDGINGITPGPNYLCASSNVISDPGVGTFRMSSYTAGTRTLAISQTDERGYDMGNWLSSWQPGTVVFLTPSADSSSNNKPRMWRVLSAGTDHGTWWEFSVEAVMGNAVIAGTRRYGLIAVPPYGTLVRGARYWTYKGNNGIYVPAETLGELYFEDDYSILYVYQDTNDGESFSTWLSSIEPGDMITLHVGGEGLFSYVVQSVATSGAPGSVTTKFTLETATNFPAIVNSTVLITTSTPTWADVD
jgi:hypothetical protein